MDRLPVIEPEETLQYLEKRFLFPPYITLAHMFKPPANWFMSPQVVPQYQLLYGVEGRAELKLDQHSYVIRNGDAYLVPPHTLRSLHPSAQEAYCGITVTFHFGSSRSPVDHLLGQHGYLGRLQDTAVLLLLLDLIQGIEQQTPASCMKAQGLLLQVLAELLGHKAPTCTALEEKNKIPVSIVHICNYMKEQYPSTIRLDTLCDMSGLSRNYLIRQFRETYGRTPLDYLTEIRMDKAKQLVINTRWSMSEIAEQVGYADVHSFSRMFKKRLGLSPSRFASMVRSSMDLASPLELSSEA